MNSKERIALILGEQKSGWISCTSITPNILQAYEESFGEQIKTFSYPGQLKELANTLLAKDIFDWQPTRIVFVDHKPHPDFLLYKLVDFFGWQLPPITVHIYGDFTLYSSLWKKLAENIKQLHLEFICASESQAKLVNKFLKDRNSRPEVIPFPVDSNIFKPSENRARDRAFWRVDADTVLFVYAGRMSVQKNCLRLLQEMIGLINAVKFKMKVIFAGPFDDIGAPFFGIRSHTGTYFEHWKRIYEALDDKLRGSVEYVGCLRAEELASLYNAADCYVSLSLHHDEDFGMAPVEAMFCGCPAILTGWGGYRSFAKVGEEFVRVLPLKLAQGGYRISSLQLRQLLFSRAMSVLDEPKRLELVQRARENFSIQAVASQLKQRKSKRIPRFIGFNRRLEEHVLALSQRCPFVGAPKPGGFYHEIYSPYFE